MENIYRYSINNGEYGGIVFADSIVSAKEKVSKKYNNEEVCVWGMLNDDYFDADNPDVLECYGF